MVGEDPLSQSRSWGTYSGVAEPVSTFPENRNPAVVLESPHIDIIVSRVAERLGEWEPDGEGPAFQPELQRCRVARGSWSTVQTWRRDVSRELGAIDGKDVEVSVSVSIGLGDGATGKHCIAQQGAAEGYELAVVRWPLVPLDQVMTGVG